MTTKSIESSKNLAGRRKFGRFRFVAACLIALPFLLAGLMNFGSQVSAQDGAEFPVGEKLTYNISYDRFKIAGFAEIQVVAEGKLEGKDAVELSSRFVTNEFVSAAFFLIDQSRKVFASPASGLPLFVKTSKNTGVAPEETVRNYLGQPSRDHDLLTLIYQLRRTGGSGTFTLAEGGSLYTVTAQTLGAEKVATDAGEFETTFSGVQSEYLSERSITDMTINFTNDAERIPVQVRFKVGKGKFRIALAGIERAPVKASTPTPSPTKVPVQTPTPRPTPPPYVPNRPLSAEIPFMLGETLEYKVTDRGNPAGTIVFEAKERSLLQTPTTNRDSLLLQASVTRSESPLLFRSGDICSTWVDPDNLQPILVSAKFNGTFAALNQSARFDQDRGIAMPDGAQSVQMPVNTHTFQSLLYAVRSFNLKPSKDATNPVNDTRVSVFFSGSFSVFMLRPSNAQMINLRGEKVPAQLITVITGDPRLDAMTPRFWLSNEPSRVPLRISFGSIQLDLAGESNSIKK